MTQNSENRKVAVEPNSTLTPKEITRLATCNVRTVDERYTVGYWLSLRPRWH